MEVLLWPATGHLAIKSFRPGYLAPYSRTRNITFWSLLIDSKIGGEVTGAKRLGGEMTGYPKAPCTCIRIFLKAEIFSSVLAFRSYVIHARNPDFQKRSPEWRFLKMPAYHLPVDGRKRWTNSILGLTPKFEPGPHWWEASALTNAPATRAPLASLATTKFPKKLGQIRLPKQCQRVIRQNSDSVSNAGTKWAV